MRRVMRVLGLPVLALALLTACSASDVRLANGPNDLALVGGRVIDPESGLDAVRNIAVREGRIVAVTEEAVVALDTIDARGLVVAPGFIDLHSHAQDSAAYLAMVRGGTTTALELEEGTVDVDGWYVARAGRAAVHHGVAIGHARIRARVMGDTAGALGTAPTGDAAHRAATDRELELSRAGAEAGLRRGAVAVGLLLGYTPGARPWEVIEIFRAAAAHGATVHAHVRELEERYWYLEVSELIGAAAATGAAAHLVHINSSMQEDAPRVLDLLRGARQRGIDITTEAYPYATAMTGIEAASFDGWEGWPDSRFGRY
jgi:N-acyl-D-aspartate/D-glutamate deacylase